MKERCGWCGTDPLYVAYHDQEWGVPVTDDHGQFEFLVLETFQAGLSWITVLRKREYFREAFDQFDVEKVARYDEHKIGSLMQNERIIRNGAKIRATVTNAQAFIRIRDEFGSFSKYIWSFTGGKPILNTHRSLSDVPPVSAESDALSKDLKKRGFKFVGSTVMYAHMQATGMINDHLVSCFRYKEIQG